MSELTFTWPRTAEHWAERTALAARLQTVVEAVGMTDIPFDIAPSELSGGQQRRLALALQLVRQVRGWRAWVLQSWEDHSSIRKQVVTILQTVLRQLACTDMHT